MKELPDIVITIEADSKSQCWIAHINVAYSDKGSLLSTDPCASWHDALEQAKQLISKDLKGIR